jgi:hypothetical protein
VTFSGRVLNPSSLPIERVRVYGVAAYQGTANDGEAFVDASLIPPHGAATFRFLVRSPAPADTAVRCQLTVLSWR